MNRPRLGLLIPAGSPSASMASRGVSVCRLTAEAINRRLTSSPTEIRAYPIAHPIFPQETTPVDRIGESAYCSAPNSLEASLNPHSHKELPFTPPHCWQGERPTVSEPFTAETVVLLCLLMLELSTLPDLPLLLAGLPQQVQNLLQAVGVPAQAYSAGNADVGRFVLFDSRRPHSVQQARQARRAGRRPIDIADCGWPAENLGPNDSVRPFAARFIQRLKEDLETQGGLWLRIADFPFPYQSALCVSLSYGRAGDDDELPELDGTLEIQKSFALTGTPFPPVTHFVPSQLRGEALLRLRRSGFNELGWTADEDSLESSVRRTQSHWNTRQQRFLAAGLTVDGLWLAADESVLPGIAALNNLGFVYSATNVAEQQPATLTTVSNWTRFDVVTHDQWLQSSRSTFPRLIAASGDGSSHVLSPVPVRSPVTQALAAADRRGRPVFWHAAATEPQLSTQFTELFTAAAALPRLWLTSHRQFARWWMQRMELQVRVWKEAVGYSLQFRDLGACVPAVELWRGQHRAVLPMTQPRVTVHDAEVAFVYAHNYSPGGLATPGDDAGFHSATEQLRSIPQTVEIA